MLPVRVYLSLTRHDWTPYQTLIREAVLALGLMPVTAGEPPLAGADPLTAITARIDSCQLFVGIYSHHPGDLLPGTTTPVIEAEYDHARRQHLPMLILLADPEALVPAQRVARGTAGELIEAFRERLQAQALVTLFTAAGDLQARLFFGLHQRVTHLEHEHGMIQMQPIFGPPSPEAQFRSDVFVMMPFAEAFHPIYTGTIVPTVEALGLSIRRGDDYFSRHAIIQEIWSAIYYSQLVIADCTGRNVNVAYELGIAHTLGKPGILIAQAMSDIPFDLQHLRYIIYEPTPDGLNRLASQLRHALEWLMMHPESGG